MDICFYVLSSGTELMLIYVMCLCVGVYILVDVCMGRSTGWRDLLYNFGAYIVFSRESVV